MKRIRQFRIVHFLLLIICVMLSGRGFSQQSDSRATMKVSGVVTNEQGEPLIGANVIIDGTNQGKSTNDKGEYVIDITGDVGQKTVLKFYYIGMKDASRTLVLSSSTLRLNVKMLSDTHIEEIIVQGYGRTQNNEDLIGSAFQVNAADLEFKPLSRVDNLLDGLVPGMSIEPNADYPGSPQTRYNTRVRGEASLSASNEPLWIIDGVPIYTGTGTNTMPGMSYSVSPLSFINPTDIQSITVLKDASEVSIYGADGANGVILVTTKSGSTGGVVRRDISANIRYGVSSIDQSTKYKVLNAEQYMDYAKTAWVNGGNSIDIFPYQDNELNSYSTTDTNWYDEFYGLGQNLSATLSISESREHSSSYFSLSYYGDSSTLLGNEQERISARMNNTYKLGQRFTLRTILSASYNINDLFAASHEYYEVLPIFSPYDEDGYTYRLYNQYVSGVSDDGELEWTQSKFWDNTIADRELSSNQQRNFTTDANLAIDCKVIEGLTATTQFGVSYSHNYEKIFYSRFTLSGMDGTDPIGYSRRASASYLSWTNISRLNYDRTFGKHTFTGLAGIELSSKGYDTLYATGSDFINDFTQEIGYASSDSRYGYSSTSTTRKLSFLGQAGYSYDRRYGVQVNTRYEGNSSFGEYSRWGNYFSVGGTWNINNEKFFLSNTLDILKLKASFGTSGNSRVDSALMRGLGTFTYGDTYSYNGTIGGVVGTAENPGLSWEKTYMTNVGINTRLWKRLAIAVETYYNYTTDLLSKVYVSRLIGEDRMYANIGEISNLGVEMTINSTNIDKEHFRWETDFNIAHNRNRVEKLADGTSISYGTTISAVGYDVNSFYLVRWAGVDPNTGDPMWYDADGNLTYSYSTDNRVIDKSSTPAAYGGITNTFVYKNFSVSMQINYSIGGYALSTLDMHGLCDGYDVINQNVSVNSLDYWQNPGDVTSSPKISTVSSSSGMSSTRFLYNKTNFKLQNLSVSYMIPEEITNKMKLAACRVSLIGDNLYLFTPDQNADLNSYKTVMYGYPVERTISLNLDVTF